MVKLLAMIDDGFKEIVFSFQGHQVFLHFAAGDKLHVSTNYHELGQDGRNESDSFTLSAQEFRASIALSKSSLEFEAPVFIYADQEELSTRSCTLQIGPVQKFEVTMDLKDALAKLKAQPMMHLARQLAEKATRNEYNDQVFDATYYYRAEGRLVIEGGASFDVPVKLRKACFLQRLPE